MELPSHSQAHLFSVLTKFGSLYNGQRSVALQLFKTSIVIQLDPHVAALLFSGSLPLLTLLVNCFPDQSRGVFQELKGRSQLNVIGGARVLAPASRSRRKTLLSAP